MDNLTLQGRLDEAMELYDSLCQRAGPLGLLPEQINPSSGDFLGNHPQALSHVGLISSGVLLERALRHEPFRTRATSWEDSDRLEAERTSGPDLGAG